jgi:hypothetical protein
VDLGRRTIYIFDNMNYNMSNRKKNIQLFYDLFY